MSDPEPEEVLAPVCGVRLLFLLSPAAAATTNTRCCVLQPHGPTVWHRDARGFSWREE